MKQALCDYISNTLLDPEDEISVKPDDDLLEAGMLDSLQMMRLVQHIEAQIQKKIPPSDLTLENFQTVNAIMTYLQVRQQ